MIVAHEHVCPLSLSMVRELVQASLFNCFDRTLRVLVIRSQERVGVVAWSKINTLTTWIWLHLNSMVARCWRHNLLRSLGASSHVFLLAPLRHGLERLDLGHCAE